MKFIRSLYRLPPFMFRTAPAPPVLPPTLRRLLAKFVDVDYHFQVLTFHFQFVRQAQKMLLYLLCLRKVGRQRQLQLPLCPCSSFYSYRRRQTVSWALLSRLSAICGILYCARACLLLPVAAIVVVVGCGII